MKVDEKTSENIIDRRPIATHGLAWTLGLLFGAFFRPDGAPPSTNDPDRDLVMLASTALDRGQTFWAAQFASSSRSWRDARVVLFTGATKTPCGRADATTGPFYCPPDTHIYLDLAFLRAIHGDLARAYVLAHELGHHVQALRGELDGRPSVEVELQADCYAGEWMRNEQALGDLGEGDVPGAIAEAEAVGDDRICPGCSTEQWTHGSSEQRAGSVMRGLGGGCP